MHPVWRPSPRLSYSVFDHILLALLLGFLGKYKDVSCQSTQAPIVGILVQDYGGDYKDYKFNKTFIAATYVKFVESAGGRVVPIHTDQPTDYYDRMLSQVNGILLPGGDQDTVNSSYTRATRVIYERVIDLNEKGTYLPVWAVCQGFEVLSYLTAGQNPLESCTADDFATPIRFALEFDELASKSKIFRQLSLREYQDMGSQPVVFQWHHFCLMRETYTKSQPLQSGFQALATNVDQDGKEYISVMESRKYPIYGVIFHPEEVLFGFLVKANHMSVPHTRAARQTSQYFANFFLDECRKSPNKMDPETLEQQVIYNFVPEHTSKLEPYDLCYFFDRASIHDGP